MCGRIALFTPPERLARLLEATLATGVDPAGTPSWNIGPQRRLFAVTEEDGARLLGSYTWGLVPSWATDSTIGNRLFNARGETVAEKPSFRSAFAKRPCVVPVDGFYEWDRRGSTKEPHFFTRRDGAVLLLAGLFEYPRAKEPGDDTPARRTCTVITTSPSDDMEGIHDRMPVVLERDAVDVWLDAAPDVAPIRRGLLVPAATGTLEHHRVGTAVGNVRHDGPELIEPLP